MPPHSKSLLPTPHEELSSPNTDTVQQPPPKSLFCRFSLGGSQSRIKFRLMTTHGCLRHPLKSVSIDQ
ncbi:hypothetical protein NECAME_02531 [Necator americanus]|uniref:Uncharacterized protein n=1 Tax=Necator americanus TaxID=51031 RepID=W2TCZ7_NECAM|nr:hypothetical protein NECAME_02531 [Necator americanus]ETN79708.1 hypothetical protein NECAME_02531 [Necator americanus]